MRSAFRSSLALGLVFGLSACGGIGATNDGASDGTDSAVATSVVSGAVSVQSGSAVGFNDAPKFKRSPLERVLDAVNPIGTAFAATWTCSGDSLDPKYAGPGSYQFTPVSCTVAWGNGKTGSSKWSGTFALDYGASCSATHPELEVQPAACSITRTTAQGGNTRTITGPDGNSYSVTHDTNGAGSGYDSSVSPAPSNGGVIATCGSSGCADGGNLVISGSHLTGMVSLADGLSATVWDHTVSSGAGGLTVTGAGTSRVVNGSVTVQHNLAKYTAQASFDNVGYGEAGCCFPTTGSVTTTFSSGSNAGKTESLAFSAICGAATLTKSDGKTVPIILQHCL
jgi:hypothetical protein